MKAAVWYGQKDVRVEDRKSKELQDNEVKVKVVEVSGSGDGPSIDIVHLSPGKDDLRHVIVALPLRDGLGREEIVQDEEDIGARFVCFGDELVGVHFGWSRSSEIAVASEVSDRFR